MTVDELANSLFDLVVKIHKSPDPIVKETALILQLLSGALVAEEPFREAFFDQIRETAQNVRSAMKDLPWSPGGS